MKDEKQTSALRSSSAAGSSVAGAGASVSNAPLPELPTTATTAAATTAHSSSPKTDRIHTQLLNNARTFYQLGDVVNAQKLYEQLLLTVPNNPNILNDFGAVLKQSNQLNRAKEMFLKATLVQPGYLVAHNNLGVVYQEMGKNF